MPNASDVFFKGAAAIGHTLKAIKLSIGYEAVLESGVLCQIRYASVVRRSSEGITSCPRFVDIKADARLGDLDSARVAEGAPVA